MAFSNNAKIAGTPSGTNNDNWKGFSKEIFDTKKRNNDFKQQSCESTNYNSAATTRAHSKAGTGINLAELNPQGGKLKGNSIIYENMSFSNEISDPSDDKSPNILQQTGEFSALDFGHEEIGRKAKEKSKGTILIEIALEANRIETLKYRKGDSVRELAVKFCREHNLSPEIAIAIENVIQGNLERINRKNLKNQSGNESEEISKEESESLSSRDSKRQKDRPAVAIELDLGGRLDVIYAFEGDDPELLAAKFCEKNGIGEDAMPFLIQTIQTELKKLKELNASQDNQPSLPEKASSDGSKGEPLQLSTIHEESQTPNTTIRGKESETYERWHRLISEKNSAVSTKKQAKTPTGNTRSPVATPRNDTGGSSKPTDAIFDKLYYEGLKFKKDQEQRRIAYQAEKMAQEKELTFKPNITPLNPSVLKNRSQSPIFEPKRYHAEVKKVIHKEKALETEKYKALQEECPFKPTISETSRQLASRKSRSPSPNIHGRLHEEARAKKIKREEIVDEGLAKIIKPKPDISPRSKELALKAKETQKERTARLVNEAKEKQEKLFQNQKAKTLQVDPKTGHPLFHPVISHDKYYQKLKEQDDARAQISLDPKTLKVRKLNSPKPSQESDDSADPVRETLIRRIFDTLDGDRDGLISTPKVDIKALEVNILKKITKVLYLLEDKYINGMDYAQFVDEINKRGLAEELVRISKKNLLKMASKDENTEDSGENEESTKKKSLNVSIRINPLETVVQAMNTENSFSRSISPRPNKSANTSVNMSNNSELRITKNYQRILSQKTPR